MYLSLLSFSHIDIAIRARHHTVMKLFDQIHQAFRVNHYPQVKTRRAIFPCGAKDDSGGGRESSQSPFSIYPDCPLRGVFEGDAEFCQAIPDAV
jgi:hypothetical protein